MHVSRSSIDSIFKTNRLGTALNATALAILYQQKFTCSFSGLLTLVLAQISDLCKTKFQII